MSVDPVFDIFEPTPQIEAFDAYDLYIVEPDASDLKSYNTVINYKDKNTSFMKRYAKSWITHTFSLYNKNNENPYSLPVVGGAEANKDDLVFPIDSSKLASLVNFAPLDNRLEFLVNNEPVQVVEDSGHARLIKALLNYSPDYLESHGEREFLFLDTGNGKTKIQPDFSLDFLGLKYPKTVATDGEPEAKKLVAGDVDTAIADAIRKLLVYISNHSISGKLANGNVNEGFFKRLLITANKDPASGNQILFTVSIPFASMFTLFDNFDKIMQGTENTLRITKNSPEAYLHTGGGAEVSGVNRPLLELVNTKWYIPYVKPTLVAQSFYLSKLNTNNQLKIHYEGYTTHISSNYKAKSKVNYSIPLTNTRITKVIFTILPAIDELDELNNAVFVGSNLTSVRFVLNNVSYPNYSIEGKERFLQSYLDCTGKRYDTDTGVLVNPDNWHLYPLFCMDFTKYSDALFEIQNSTLQFIATGGVPQYDGVDCPFIIKAVVFSDKELTISTIENKVFLRS